MARAAAALDVDYYPGYIAVKAGVARSERIGQLTLARPAQSNAWDAALWEEFPRAVRALAADGARVIVIDAEGKHFTAGLDLKFMQHTFLGHVDPDACPARARLRLLEGIRMMQDVYNCLEEVGCPIIVAVHGACVGAGVDLACACDIRYCSRDAFFCVKEVDVAIAADLGTLQRLPRIVGQGMAAELALTARRMSGTEAEARGLVSRCCEDREQLMEQALSTARVLAAKPPMALMGTKRMLLHARDHSVAEGLDHVALWNCSFMLGDDMRETLAAQSARRPPRYSKL